MQKSALNRKVKENLKACQVRMGSQEVVELLGKCLRAAAAAAAEAAETAETSTDVDRHNYCSVRDSLCAELALLLQEASEMRWPFVPERWQFQQAVGSRDKSNLNELVGQHLPQLLNVLEAAIVARDARAAFAVIFLLDRFLYWTDESGSLLKISKLLHKRYRGAPVAPQLLIRQARVYLSSGKLQKAEHILSHLIANSGNAGCWVYRSESDRALVQAVSLQVRGTVLQKLGLWAEAAELVWASLVGYNALPRPDKKGIGTSLGILANILLSMNDEDFRAFKTIPNVDLSLLGDASHRLLSAAKAAAMAVVYSQYTSLYVLTNATAQGTCLLSYSFSAACLPAKRTFFLLQAKEAFEVGLLAKAQGEVVPSKQELHTFIKAAYSLVVTRKWLDGPSEAVTRSTRACQEALARFYDYCHADAHDRGSFCAEIMGSMARVKLELHVEPFVNSDSRSFIPDSFRNMSGALADFTLDDFSRVLHRLQKYHMSLCKTANATCKAGKEVVDGARMCITAFGTTEDVFNAECITEACGLSRDAPSDVSRLSEPRSNVANANSLGSSWKKSSLSSSASGRCAVDSPTIRRSPRLATRLSSSASHSSDKFEIVEAEIPTVGSDTPDGDHGPTDPPAGALPRSLSRLILRSSSLSNSFESESSWENISRTSRSAGSCQSSKSSESSGSFFLMKTQDCQTSDPEYDTASGWEFLCKPKALESPNVDSGSCSTTEPSTENSRGTPDELTLGPQTLNPRCDSCLESNTPAGVAPARQYLLSREDYRSLLAGVCHGCLLKRLSSDKAKFKLEHYSTAHDALHLKFSKASGLWTARETCAYIGQSMGLHGTHRTAIWVQFLHQEERLSSYVAKDYRKPTQIQFHLRDVERQMTAQYYVTEFNKRLYDKEVMAQMFFLPSEALLILDGDEIAGCVTVEPYMLGQFVKLTNNIRKKNEELPATEYGLAFGHFTYLHSNCQDVVVDLQGWVTANGKGLTYLTDPQIHSARAPRGPSNLAQSGIDSFLREQHGPQCNKATQNEQLWAFARYLYDALGHRIRLQEIGFYQNKSFTYDALLLYREALMYEINHQEHTCKKRALRVDFHPMAVPRNASLLGQAVVGSSSSPGQGLLVNTWTGKLPDNAPYIVTVTEFGCIPVSTTYKTLPFGWMVTSFFNNVIGISDPNQLNPPDFCQDALHEEPVDFFSLFRVK
ncbi:alpha-protein kinase 1 isoform X2 [Phycodurus eques]|uniref:alpha-protein kinase 1 isoform X2 n=1 Tax=Phycodurus eques TaxID=693459 RepID=UPI002ACED6D1|nr:alpha-protein kinase 1 isoform X2 [Phycodurus eques]